VEVILKTVLALIDAAKAIIPAVLVARAKDAKTEANQEKAKAIVAKAEAEGLKNAQAIDKEYSGTDRRSRLDKLLSRRKRGDKT
jgi:hypothetical protein